MDDADIKAVLHDYLRGGREALVWKIADLDEHDIRRPMTPTGTNLLGLVKHSGSTHVRYFGSVFGRHDDESLVWLCGAGPNGDLWALADESRDVIVDATRRAWAHADATIAALPTDALGVVPWWGSEPVTLHRVLMHVTAEAQRHAGHADILREHIDGAAGLLPGFDNLHVVDAGERAAFWGRVEDAARRAAGG